MAAGTVVVGGGQAGYQVAASLRAGGYDGPIHIVSDEADLPYQRPPLSKGWLAGKQDDAALPFRPEAFYRDQRIELRLGARVAAIDPAARRIRLADGPDVAWDALVLATGARPRPLPVPGADLDGVLCLRSRSDAAAIRERMAAVGSVAVIGGGFIGLEVAAAAAARGLPATVFEARDRMMPRLVAPVVSEWYRRLHAAHGVDFVPAAAVVAIEGADGRVAAVRLADGTRHAAELIVVGIGVLPNDEVAAAAGLACGDGIRVDAGMRTDHPSIFAIGDCASHPNPFAGGHVRLESVQNAADQARVAAAGLLGRDARYESVPWFWTDQFDARLQMAGLSRGHDRFVRRGDPESGRFSVFYFRAGRLVAVDSVNRPADHLAARRLLAVAAPLSPAEASDDSFDLKAALGRVPSGEGGAPR